MILCLKEHQTLQGLPPRALAVIMDTVIIVVIVIFVEAVYRQTTPAPEKLYPLGLVILPFLYFTFFEAYNNGQTLGKRLFKIRVVKFNGKPITIWQSLIRNILRIIDEIPGFYLVGFLIVVFTDYNQRLRDLAADTAVIKVL